MWMWEVINDSVHFATVQGWNTLHSRKLQKTPENSQNLWYIRSWKYEIFLEILLALALTMLLYIESIFIYLAKRLISEKELERGLLHSL